MVKKRKHLHIKKPVAVIVLVTLVFFQAVTPSFAGRRTGPPPPVTVEGPGIVANSLTPVPKPDPIPSYSQSLGNSPALLPATPASVAGYTDALKPVFGQGFEVTSVSRGNGEWGIYVSEKSGTVPPPTSGIQQLKFVVSEKVSGAQFLTLVFYGDKGETTIAGEDASLLDTAMAKLFNNPYQPGSVDYQVRNLGNMKVLKNVSAESGVVGFRIDKYAADYQCSRNPDGTVKVEKITPVAEMPFGAGGKASMLTFTDFVTGKVTQQVTRLLRADGSLIKQYQRKNASYGSGSGVGVWTLDFLTTDGLRVVIKQNSVKTVTSTVDEISTVRDETFGDISLRQQYTLQNGQLVKTSDSYSKYEIFSSTTRGQMTRSTAFVMVNGKLERSLVTLSAPSGVVGRMVDQQSAYQSGQVVKLTITNNATGGRVIFEDPKVTVSQPGATPQIYSLGALSMTKDATGFVTSISGQTTVNGKNYKIVIDPITGITTLTEYPSFAFAAAASFGNTATLSGTVDEQGNASVTLDSVTYTGVFFDPIEKSMTFSSGGRVATLSFNKDNSSAWVLTVMNVKDTSPDGSYIVKIDTFTPGPLTGTTFQTVAKEVYTGHKPDGTPTFQYDTAYDAMGGHTFTASTYFPDGTSLQNKNTTVYDQNNNRISVADTDYDLNHAVTSVFTTYYQLVWASLPFPIPALVNVASASLKCLGAAGNILSTIQTGAAGQLLSVTVPGSVISVETPQLPIPEKVEVYPVSSNPTVPISIPRSTIDYDPQGELSKITDYDPQGDIESETRYGTDENPLLPLSITDGLNPDLAVLRSAELRYYGLQGEPLRVVMTDDAGQPRSVTVYGGVDPDAAPATIVAYTPGSEGGRWNGIFIYTDPPLEQTPGDRGPYENWDQAAATAYLANILGDPAIPAGNAAAPPDPNTGSWYSTNLIVVPPTISLLGTPTSVVIQNFAGNRTSSVETTMFDLDGLKQKVTNQNFTDEEGCPKDIKTEYFSGGKLELEWTRFFFQKTKLLERASWKTFDPETDEPLKESVAEYQPDNEALVSLSVDEFQNRRVTRRSEYTYQGLLPDSNFEYKYEDFDHWKRTAFQLGADGKTMVVHGEEELVMNSPGIRNKYTNKSDWLNGIPQSVWTETYGENNALLKVTDETPFIESVRYTTVITYGEDGLLPDRNDGVLPDSNIAYNYDDYVTWKRTDFVSMSDGEDSVLRDEEWAFTEVALEHTINAEMCEDGPQLYIKEIYGFDEKILTAERLTYSHDVSYFGANGIPFRYRSTQVNEVYDSQENLLKRTTHQYKTTHLQGKEMPVVTPVYDKVEDFVNNTVKCFAPGTENEIPCPE